MITMYIGQAQYYCKSICIDKQVSRVSNEEACLGNCVLLHSQENHVEKLYFLL